MVVILSVPYFLLLLRCFLFDMYIHTFSVVADSFVRACFELVCESARDPFLHTSVTCSRTFFRTTPDELFGQGPVLPYSSLTGIALPYIHSDGNIMKNHSIHANAWLISLSTGTIHLYIRTNQNKQ